MSKSWFFILVLLFNIGCSLSKERDFTEDSLKKAFAKEDVDLIYQILLTNPNLGINIPDLIDDEGNTTLHLAVKKNHNRLIYLLLQNLPQLLEIKNNNEKTAFDVSVNFSKNSCTGLEALLLYRPKSHYKDAQSHFTYLFYKQKNLPCLEVFMLNNYLEPNLKINDKPILALAIESGWVEFVQLLLRGGANVHQMITIDDPPHEKKQMSVREYAYRVGNPAVIELFKEFEQSAINPVKVAPF